MSSKGSLFNIIFTIISMVFVIIETFGGSDIHNKTNNFILNGGLGLIIGIIVYKYILTDMCRISGTNINEMLRISLMDEYKINIKQAVSMLNTGNILYAENKETKLHAKILYNDNKLFVMHLVDSHIEEYIVEDLKSVLEYQEKLGLKMYKIQALEEVLKRGFRFKYVGK